VLRHLRAFSHDEGRASGGGRRCGGEQGRGRGRGGGAKTADGADGQAGAVALHALVAKEILAVPAMRLRFQGTRRNIKRAGRSKPAPAAVIRHPSWRRCGGKRASASTRVCSRHGATTRVGRRRGSMDIPHEVGPALAGATALDRVYAHLAEDLVDRTRRLRQRRPPVGVPAPAAPPTQHTMHVREGGEAGGERKKKDKGRRKDARKRQVERQGGGASHDSCTLPSIARGWPIGWIITCAQ
jgi:hypothetical protein